MVLTRNFGKMTFLRHLEKSIGPKTYPHAIRRVKRNWVSGVMGGGIAVSPPECTGQNHGGGQGVKLPYNVKVFCIEKISMNLLKLRKVPLK